jgi:hypothetical protein
MPGNSPFSDDWRDCLRAHFAYTVRMQDVRTEHTLSAVMQEIGFSEAEMRELRVRATLRTEDVPPDFVPDLQALAEQSPPEAARVFAVAAVPEALAEAVQEELLELEEESVIDPDEVQEAAAPPPSPDEPQQLSLF